MTAAPEASSGAAGGPLPALIQYYERLEADPTQTVAPFAFCPQEIAFCVILEYDGTLAAVEPLCELLPSKQRQRGRDLIVPFHGERSSNVLANFLWDNTGYVFGRISGKAAERTVETHRAFRELHSEMEARMPTPGLRALNAFLRRWQPARAATLPQWDKIDGTNVAFKIRRESAYLHQHPDIQRLWPEVYREHSDQRPGRSLISGRLESVVSKHDPSIKGAGGQTSGTKIVSFNADAYVSHGKEGAYNAPASIEDTFRYTTALNYLLDDKSRRIWLGSIRVVFWTDHSAATDAEEVFSAFFTEAPTAESAESGKLLDRLRAFLAAARQGRISDELADPEAPFYILGLSPNSPNASRLNVRYWLTGTVAEFAERLARHAADLEIGEWSSDKDDAVIESRLRESPNDERLLHLHQTVRVRLTRQSEPLTIQAILDETVPAKKNKEPDRDRINPRLAAEVSRAVLSGRRLPRELWAAVLDRVLKEGLADPEKRHDWRRSRHRRMAILKACLNQFVRTNPHRKLAAVNTYLDKMHKHPAYQCGRLMAVLAYSQERALGKVNSSVVRRYLSGVVAAPAAMLGRLQVLAEVSHIPKLKGHLPSMVRDELKQINCAIGSVVPRTFDHGDQSYFVLGFYQQMAHLDTMRNTQRHRYRTRLGEWVMSKGEMHVANALAKASVRYVYEPRAVLGGQDRIPDFVVPYGSEKDNVYIEYLGMNTEDYNRRWDDKLREYDAAEITPIGGPRGRLVVIDDRIEGRDQTAIASFLMQQRVIPENGTPSEQESQHDA